jgi:hypothetical protein
VLLPPTRSSAGGAGPETQSVINNANCSLGFNESGIERIVWSSNLTLSGSNMTSANASLSGFYDTLCSSHVLTSAVSLWGVSNTTVDVYGTRTGGVQFVNFTVQWDTNSAVDPRCVNQGTVVAHQAYWSLYLPNGSSSGPHLWNGTATPYTSTCANLWGSSPNWAGYEYWDPGTALDGYSAVTEPVAMTGQPGAQNDYGNGAVDSAAAPWIGLEDNIGGAPGHLLQTGFTLDASAPTTLWCVGFALSCDYGLWYEYLPAPPYPYSGDPAVSVGDRVTLSATSIGQPSGTYLVSADDLTIGSLWHTSITVGSWTPYYADDIVETPPYASGPYEWLTQIPYFSTPMAFEFGQVCTPSQGCSINPYSLYTANYYRNDVLSQSPGVNNTKASFVYGTDFSGSKSWYPEVSWLNSSYDFCFTWLKLGAGEGIKACGETGPFTGGCVANSTKILTPSGYIAVQNLQIGASVDEYNFTSRQISGGSVSSINSTLVNETLDINEGWLNVTLTNQPIYIENRTFTGWLKDPWNLTTQDSIFDPVTNKWVPVTCITVISHLIRVFDIVTSAQKDFIANGAAMYLKFAGNN